MAPVVEVDGQAGPAAGMMARAPAPEVEVARVEAEVRAAVAEAAASGLHRHYRTWLYRGCRLRSVGIE